MSTTTIVKIASHTDGGGLHEQALEYDGVHPTHLHAYIGEGEGREHYRHPLTLIAILRDRPDWWEDYVLWGRVEGQTPAAWKVDGTEVLVVERDNSPLFASYAVGPAEVLHERWPAPEWFEREDIEGPSEPPRPALDMHTVLMGTRISLNVAAALACCTLTVWLITGMVAA